MAVKFFDTHCHLTDAPFGYDLDAVIERAAAAGVTAAVTIGTGIKDIKAALTLCDEMNNKLELAASGGLTPYDVQNAEEDDLLRLEDLLFDNELVKAVGEIGLDRYHGYGDEAKEKRFFCKQLELAVTLQLPVIIHCREAHSDMRAILHEYAKDLPYKGVIHCFSGDAADAEDYVNMGFLLSFTCAVGYKKAEPQLEVIRTVPLDRIMAETDSPYLPPADRRGKRNEPAHVGTVVQIIAEQRQLSLEAAADAVFANSKRFFRIEL